MKKLINIKKWDRMEQYIFFNKYDNPYYEVTSEINCDNIFKLSKQKKYNYNAENNLKTKTKQINNVAYFTCFPWIKITSFKNAHNGIDYNSRICWGKYYKENNLYYINISIEVNHSIIDGYHIGKFFTILQKNIEELEVLL